MVKYNFILRFHYCKETIEEIGHCCTVMDRISPSDQLKRDITHSEAIYRTLKNLKRERTNKVTNKASITRFELIKTMVRYPYT